MIIVNATGTKKMIVPKEPKTIIINILTRMMLIKYQFLPVGSVDHIYLAQFWDSPW